MREKRRLPVVGQSVSTTKDDGELRRSVVRVEGMDCASCAVTVERSVARVPGVARAVVNFGAGRLEAEHDKSVGREEIEEAVRAAGYRVGEGEKHRRSGFWREGRVWLTLASVLALMAGFWLWAAGSGAYVAAYAVAIVVGGTPIFGAALRSLRLWRMDMNVLMSAAVIGAMGIGAWAEAALVVVLFATGNVLQAYSIDRTRTAVRELAELVPARARVRSDGAERDIPVEEVSAGDLVIIRPGERVAVDGEVLEGQTTVNEASITGESAPVEKAVGDRVLSGSLNGGGAVILRAVSDAAGSTLQRVMRMVEEAQAGKAPSERFVDRFSGIYTPIVVALAVALAVVPVLMGGDFGTWFYRALALLIIACPCALVISTPVTVVSGIGAASRAGILIKGGEALEAAGGLRSLFFDKTGTLTEGRPRLVRTIMPGGIDEGQALRIAGALESRSAHPLAHAILSAAGKTVADVKGFRDLPGRGACGVVEGKEYLVGSPALFTERGFDLEEAGNVLVELEEAGETPVLLGGEEGVIAVFGLADEVRPGAREAVEELRKAGVTEIVMLTGDAQAPARRVARQLGVDYRAGLLPQQKLEEVRKAVRERGATGVVGDGVNDAPALAAATVGFAMGAAGSGVATEAADVALMRDDLSKLSEAVWISRRAGRILRQNILASVVIKGIFVLLAPFGLVTLWLAVLADMGTSLAVTANGLRLFRKRQGRG